MYMDYDNYPMISTVNSYLQMKVAVVEWFLCNMCTAMLE